MAQGALDNSYKPLKADRPHPRDYSTQRQTPWTDNDSSLLFAGSAVRALMDRRTDRRTDATKYIISLASRSIIRRIDIQIFFRVLQREVEVAHNASKRTHLCMH